ncbi:hypothetical protein RC52_22175 [Herbaspirillum rubrisubalbicans]|nr:hypothetical protein [Herbaspirillum rubrisubalbicans]
MANIGCHSRTAILQRLSTLIFVKNSYWLSIDNAFFTLCFNDPLTDFFLDFWIFLARNQLHFSRTEIHQDDAIHR